MRAVALVILIAPLVGCDPHERHPSNAIHGSAPIDRLHWAVEAAGELWLVGATADEELVLLRLDDRGEEVRRTELSAGNWAAVSPMHDRVVVAADDGVVVQDLAGVGLGSAPLPAADASFVMSGDKLLLSWGTWRQASGLAILDIAAPEIIKSYDMPPSLYRCYSGDGELFVVPRNPSQEEPGYSVSMTGDLSQLDGIAGHTVVGRLDTGSWVLSKQIGKIKIPSVLVEDREILLPRQLRIYWGHVVAGECLVYEDERGATVVNLVSEQSLAIRIPSGDDRDRLDVLRVHGTSHVLLHRGAEYWIIDTTSDTPRVIETAH